MHFQAELIVQYSGNLSKFRLFAFIFKLLFSACPSYTGENGEQLRKLYRNARLVVGTVPKEAARLNRIETDLFVWGVPTYIYS